MHKPLIQHIGEGPKIAIFGPIRIATLAPKPPCFFDANEYQFPLFSILDLPLSRLIFFAKIECRKGRILATKIALHYLSFRMCQAMVHPARCAKTRSSRNKVRIAPRDIQKCREQGSLWKRFTNAFTRSERRSGKIQRNRLTPNSFETS